MARFKTGGMTQTERDKDKRLKDIYKSSLEEFNQKLADQKFCCAICERPFVKGAGNQKWKKEVYSSFQDHSHDCCPRRLKKFCGRCNRGLLCYTCNKFVVGIMEKSDIPVDRLYAYMTKWTAILKKKGCDEKTATVLKEKTSVRRSHASVSR